MKKLIIVLKSVVLVGLATIALGACGTGSVLGTTLTVNGTTPGSPLARVAGSRSLASRSLGWVDIPVEYPAGTPVGIINLTTAKVVIKEMQIEQEGVTDALVDFEFNGPFVADLITNTLDPQPMVADLPAGIYAQIEFKIDKIEGDETDERGAALVPNDDPLFGHSILLEGSYTPTGGAAIPFSYTFDVDAEFQLKAAGDTATGFEIAASGVNDIIIAFRLNKWFSGIDPAAFAADPAAFSEALKENIKLSADYGKDTDGDGVLSSAEDDDPDSEDAEDA